MSALPNFAFLMLAVIGSLGAIMAVLGMLWASGNSTKSRRSRSATIEGDSISQSWSDLAH